MNYFDGTTFSFGRPAGMSEHEIARFRAFAERELPGATITIDQASLHSRLTCLSAGHPTERRGASVQEVDVLTGAPKGPVIDVTGSNLFRRGQEVVLGFYRQQSQ